MFNASASVAPEAPISEYAWSFGDGSSVVSASPSIIHGYNAGSYVVVLTETDADGTSTKQVFTGQTMSLNGGPSATTSARVSGGSGSPKCS